MAIQTTTLHNLTIPAGTTQTPTVSIAAGHSWWSFQLDTSPWASGSNLTCQAFFSYDGGVTFTPAQVELIPTGQALTPRGRLPGFTQPLPQDGVACRAFAQVTAPSTQTTPQAVVQVGP